MEVKLSEERAWVCLTQLNVEIEKEENNVIMQGHSNNTNVTPCNKILKISQLGRLLETPGFLFASSTHLSLLPRILWKLQGSCFNYFLPLGFLQIKSVTLPLRPMCPSQAYSGIDQQYMIISKANIYRVPSILHLFGPHKSSLKPIHHPHFSDGETRQHRGKESGFECRLSGS